MNSSKKTATLRTLFAALIGVSASVLPLSSSALQANDAETASAQTLQAESVAHRYELSRSESILTMNIEIDEETFAKANYLHLENVFTGQTYRVKMRNGTHLLKVEAGVYRADFERLNSRLFGDKAAKGASIETPSMTEITLRPQTVNFVGTWSFADNGDFGQLTIGAENNPSFALAKRYPVMSKYQLQSAIGNSTKLVAKQWPLDSRELVGFRD